MFSKEYKIYTAKEGNDISQMAHSIFSRIDKAYPLLKITFFGLPRDNKEYKEQRTALHIAAHRFFGNDCPLISFVAQKPYAATLTAETTSLTAKGVTKEHGNGYIILSNENARELISEGLVAEDLNKPVGQQAADVFHRIDEILKKTGFGINDIYRQWNYIENITAIKNGQQNYQQFNEARSLFYNHAEWNNGYPAATGIGTSCGGMMIEFYACSKNVVPNMPIDNPLQIAAHSYSQQVLAGNDSHRTTPKFERARLICDTVYISGTAAIKGEESADTAETIQQAELTMQIMDRLTVPENMPVPCTARIYSLLRIYVKNCDETASVKQYMDTHYPAVPKHYLTSDICRDELLIEIEGVARIS